MDSHAIRQHQLLGILSRTDDFWRQFVKVDENSKLWIFRAPFVVSSP